MRSLRQENYKKWIVRLKLERVFNLYDCEKFLEKFNNANDIDNGTKGFEEFEKQSGNERNVSSRDKPVSRKASNSFLSEDFWNEMEVKANTEEAATSYR